MRTIVDRLLKWCSDPSSEDIRDLISPEANITEIFGEPSNYKSYCERLKEQKELDYSNWDFELVETAISEDKVTIIFDTTDELTGLRYRFCLFVNSHNGKIIRIIEMREDISAFHARPIITEARDV